jgi:predicted Zn-dependent peptidase
MRYPITRRSMMAGALLGGASLAAFSPVLAQTAARAAASGEVFPFPVHRRDLPNGLRVFVIETGFPDIVSLQIPVSVGSRNEVEPGKSGFAHFFEHMMFRGTKNVPAAEYQRIMKAVGADTNAYTSDDVTNYHATFNKEDLDTVLRLEGDRFQNLEYAEPEFRTEALAVLGEYNKNAANPIQKLIEVQRNTAFTTHTYKHTTMGFIEDIRQMPEQFAYSRQFFDRYYRPERTSIIIAGDVQPQAAFAMVEKYWGSWRPGGAVPAVPTEPAPRGPQYVHVPWESETAPWVSVAFRGPAAYPTPNNPAKGDQQALDVLASYAFSPSSALYQRLVVKEQKAETLGSNFPDRVDPSLLNVIARLKSKADLAYVRDAIQQELASLRTQPADPRRIADIKSALKYGFASALDNTESVASVVVEYVAATRDVNTLNEVYRLYDAVTPADIQRVARKYFTDRGMIVSTLAHGDVDAAAKAAGSVDRYLQAGVPGAAAAAPAAALAAGAGGARARRVQGAGAADQLAADRRADDVPGRRRRRSGGQGGPRGAHRPHGDAGGQPRPDLPADPAAAVPDGGGLRRDRREGDHHVRRKGPPGQRGPLVRHHLRHAARSRLPGRGLHPGEDQPPQQHPRRPTRQQRRGAGERGALRAALRRPPLRAPDGGLGQVGGGADARRRAGFPQGELHAGEPDDGRRRRSQRRVPEQGAWRPGGVTAGRVREAASHPGAEEAAGARRHARAEANGRGRHLDGLSAGRGARAS